MHKRLLARIVRRRSTRIDTNDIINLVDGKMRVKAIAISNRKVSREIGKKIRKTVRDSIKEMLGNLKTEEFISEMIGGKIQSKIRKDVSKVYPLRQFEFRKQKFYNFTIFLDESYFYQTLFRYVLVFLHLDSLSA